MVFSLKKNGLASLKACSFQNARLKGLSGKIAVLLQKTSQRKIN
jgi:hypothetical protein